MFFFIWVVYLSKKGEMKKEKKSVNNQLVTLKIDKPTHARIKKYCKDNEYWMHSFVEHIMNEYLDKHKNK